MEGKIQEEIDPYSIPPLKQIVIGKSITSNVNHTKVMDDSRTLLSTTGNSEEASLSSEQNSNGVKDNNDERWNSPKQVQEHTKTSWEKYLHYSTKAMIGIYIFLLLLCILGSGCLSRILVHIMIWKINPPHRNTSSYMTMLFGNLIPDPDRSSRNITCANISCNEGLPLHWECRAIDSGDMCSLAEEIPTVNAAWYWAIMLTFSAPYVYSFLSNLSIKCAKYTEEFSRKIFVIGFFKEAVHSVGLCIMVFFVLPIFTPDVAAIVGLFMTVIPSILHIWIRWTVPIINNTHNSANLEEKQRSMLSTPKIGFVIAVFGCLILGISMILFGFSMCVQDPKIIGLFVTGITCMSVDWFEAFWTIYAINDTPRVLSFMHSYILEEKEFETCVLSALKLVFNFVSVIIVIVIHSGENDEALSLLFSFDTTNTTAELHSLRGTMLLENTDALAFGCHYDSPFLIMVISVISNFVFFKLSHHACRITYQKLLFSTPVCLVSATVPVILSVMLLFSDSFIVDECSVLQPLWMVNVTSGDTSNWFLRIAFIIGLISLILVNVHVWKVQGMDLAKARSLFVKMKYCGIFPDVSLLLSRNIVDDKLKIKREDDKSSDSPNNTQSKPSNTTKNYIPYIIACATMWHEEYKEMRQLLSSIFTLDFEIYKNPSQYKFDFDANIFFDDAFCGEGRDRKLNQYTNYLYKAIRDTMKLIYQCDHDPPYPLEMEQPVKYETPYGLKIIWKLKGEKKDSHGKKNTLTVHFKDKDKIRNKKRWSQVMYFYYNLSYSMNFAEEEADHCLDNIYILALDGDVEFKPSAVQHLLRGMERSKNKEVGACCGRIHPIGSGPMAWYQKFEYAASHWLQKSTEHVAGCVLCSPGCFTLVRGSALLDDNVMRTYANEADKAIEHIQFDQGEDRWLCTLLLKRGKRIEYCAAADAYTFAPEGFSEFFKQRRRWTPSTLANIYDIITDWDVADKNNSITKLFLLYQLFLFVTAIITPGTILLLMYGAIIKTYGISTWIAFLIVLIPVMIFIFAVIILPGKVQLQIAALLSGLYGIMMMMVLIGIFKSGIESGWCSDTTIFIILVAGVFVVAALLHPQEFTCILPGILYIFCVPSMSMLLLIYAIGNINETSWGTREEATDKGQNASGQGASCSLGTLLRCICCPTSRIDPMEEKGNGCPRLFRRTLKDQNLKVDDKMCLKAVVTGNPKPSVQWMKDGAMLKSSPIWTIKSTSRSRCILKTAHIQLSHAGTYTCTATNENGTAEVTWKVEVTTAEGNTNNKSKGFVNTLSDKTLYKGDRLHLKAYFFDSRNNDIIWEFIPKKKDKKDKHEVKDNETVQRWITDRDTENDQDQDNKDTDSTNKIATSDSSLNYEADCQDRTLKRKIKKINLDDRSVLINPGDSSSFLTNKDVTPQDAGQYICRISGNNVKNAEVKATIKVLEIGNHDDQPAIFLEPWNNEGRKNDSENTLNDRTLIVGQKLVLKMWIKGFSEPPVVKWLRNRTQLPVSDERLSEKTRIEVPHNEGMVISRHGTLYKWTIDKVKKLDSGRYICKVYEGDEVKAEKTVTIIIKEKSESTSHYAELEKVEAGKNDSNGKEEKFWYSIINTYLSPDLSDQDAMKQQQIIKSELKDLRNKLFFAFLLINTMYVVLVYSMTEVSANKELLYFRISCPASSKVPYMDINPISVVFTLTFGVILVFQFFGMLYHRFSTFAQILVHFKSEVPINSGGKKKTSKKTNRSKAAFLNDDECKECRKSKSSAKSLNTNTDKHDSSQTGQQSNKTVFNVSFMATRWKNTLKDATK